MDPIRSASSVNPLARDSASVMFSPGVTGTMRGLFTWPSTITFLSFTLGINTVSPGFITTFWLLSARLKSLISSRLDAGR